MAHPWIPGPHQHPVHHAPGPMPPGPVPPGPVPAGSVPAGAPPETAGAVPPGPHEEAVQADLGAGYPPMPPTPPVPPAPPGPPGFPFGRPVGPPRPGPRVRRGDVRAAVLALLAEGPRNGYQVIQEIGRRSGGVWRPSPGSVYPALQQLQDEDLVRSREAGNRREFELTEAGEHYVATHPDELAAPFANAAETVSDESAELWRSLHVLNAAAAQVVQAGSAEQVTAAESVLSTARRDLYRILAGDAPPPDRR